MKPLLVFSLAWLINLLSSCEKDDPALPADCTDGVAFVKRVDNVIGNVYYDSTQTTYVIKVPNSLDSYDVGYLCSLDAKYQSEGLRVKFSGRYYEYYRPLPIYWSDNRNYSLSVETISLY